MKHFIAMIVLAVSPAISMTVGATPRNNCDCDSTPTLVTPTVSKEISKPTDSAMDAETGDSRWERAQAVAERDREYSAVERLHNDRIYRVASHLIDAQYDVANAEIDQVVLRKLRLAIHELAAARNEIDTEVRLARAKQRLALTALRNQLQRVDLANTPCHGQTHGEDRFQYERLKAQLHREILVL